MINTLLTLMNEAVMIIDHKGRISGWSHGAQNLLGYGSTAVVDQPATLLCSPASQQDFASRLEGLGAGRDSAEIHAPLIDSSGMERLFTVRMRQIQHNETPVTICTLSMLNEQGTESDLSTQQIRGLWALLESVPVGFLYIDNDQRFRYVNKAALRMLPPGRTSIVGRHLLDVFGEDIYGQLKPQVDLALSGRECSSEVSVTLPDGTARHMLRHVHPHLANDGSIRGYFSALLDVTEAKIAQESMLRREQSLRSTLVREINHRVKNSLQGLIGIMRLYDPVETTPAALIDECVSKLMAVAVAFGLASKHGEARILLCDMVRDIAHSVGEVTHCGISVNILPNANELPIPLTEAHAVNISIVINEIVFNAAKHSVVTACPPNVRISVDRNGCSAFVRVANPGRLPPDFSFASGKGLGTGLSLVRVLVPPDSCELTISTEPEGTVAVLRLAPPVLA